MPSRRSLAWLAVLGLLIGTCPVAAQPATRPASPSVTRLPEPAPTEPGAHWIDVPAPARTTLRAAAAWPDGDGPAPVVVVLHGSEGFSEDDVRLAEAFAREGFLSVAGCWFGGDLCPHGPPFTGANLVTARYVTALVAASRALPRARSDRIGLFGHSRGGMLALLAASSRDDVQAVVASSAQLVVAQTGGRRLRHDLDTPPLPLARQLHAPVLLLHSLADDVAEVQRTLEYEQTLRELAKVVEAHYYQGAPHRLETYPGTQDDVLARAVAFFRRHLGS